MGNVEKRSTFFSLCAIMLYAIDERNKQAKANGNVPRLLQFLSRLPETSCQNKKGK